MERCKHNFINANDGSLDKICVICGKRAMQAAMYINPEMKFEASIPSRNESLIYINTDVNTEELEDKIINIINRSISRKQGARL